MGIKILGIQFGKAEERASFSNSPTDPIWGAALSGGLTTKAGEIITPDNALNISTVHACVRVIAETIASLPLKLYRRKSDGTKELALKHPLYKIMHRRPNENQTAFEYKEQKVTQLCLRGNGYGLIERTNAGVVANIIPLDPARMEVAVANGQPRYKYTWLDGKQEIISPDRIWHIRGLSTNGYEGLSPVTLAREAMGLASATEGHGARLFKNGAKPGGILTTPGTLTEKAIERLKKTWSKAYSGDNQHNVAVLEQDLKYQVIGFSNEDSQFLQTRTFQVEEITRIYRVPPFLIGHPDKTSTYASAEQSMTSFIKHTIRPYVERIEQSADRALLTEKEQDRYFFEFDMEGLLRGDSKARAEFYASGIQNEWLSPNEARAKENLNPREGGDEFKNPATNGASSMEEGDGDGDEGNEDS
jgi:HK97 family phage portal protein